MTGPYGACPPLRCNATLLAVLLLAGSSVVWADPLESAWQWQDADAVVALEAVPQPSLAGTEEGLQDALRGARAELADLVARADAGRKTLAEAYGQMGRFYHAHHLYAAAAACYRNAERLAPNEHRWVYLLGYVHHQASEPHKALLTYQRAVRLREDFAPARLRLAMVYVELGRPDDARPLLLESQRVPATRAAALFALGRMALERGDFGAARDYFAQTVAEQPEATQVHYPLAMAYRGLGDIDQARAHLRLRGDGEPKIEDPLVDELAKLLTGPRTQYFRAIEAVRDGHYEDAVYSFRAALALDPDNVNARVSLARALYLAGQHAAASRQLEDALRQQPTHALGNFLLGALQDEQGLGESATEHYRQALHSEPDHAGAHFLLAHALMRRGLFEAASVHYARAAELVPDNHVAALLEAMALLRAGAPRAKVRDRLADAVGVHPEQGVLKQALARVLATMPEETTDSGRHALKLARQLFDESNTLENAETLAMAYAQAGHHHEAVSLQRDALEAAAAAGHLHALPRLQQNLERYEREEVVREPFGLGETIALAPPPSAFGPFRDYPTLYAY